MLVNGRLFPDMFPLARQVMIVTDNAKGGAARLAGLEPPRYEDNESSFPELMARIDKTAAYLKTFTPDQIDGSEGRTINMKVGGKPMTFCGITAWTSAKRIILEVFDHRGKWALRLLSLSCPPQKFTRRKPILELVFWVLTEHDIVTYLASR